MCLVYASFLRMSIRKTLAEWLALGVDWDRPADDSYSQIGALEILDRTHGLSASLLRVYY